MSFKMDVEEYLAGTEQVLCNFPSILCRLCRAQRTKEALTILSTGFPFLMIINNLTFIIPVSFNLIPLNLMIQKV